MAARRAAVSHIRRTLRLLLATWMADANSNSRAARPPGARRVFFYLGAFVSVLWPRVGRPFLDLVYRPWSRLASADLVSGVVGLRYRASHQPLRDKIAVCAGGRQSRLGDYRAAGRAGGSAHHLVVGTCRRLQCSLPARTGARGMVRVCSVPLDHDTAIGHRSPADGYSDFPRTSRPHCSRICDVALVFPVPLAVWLVLRRLHDGLAPGRFVAGLAILIAAQFLFFAEVAASATFAGAIAFALALAFTDANITAPALGTRTANRGGLRDRRDHCFPIPVLHVRLRPCGWIGPGPDAARRGPGKFSDPDRDQ